MKHTIPRLDTPDAVFSIGFVDISVRQFLFLIFGSLISVNVWMQWSGWLSINWLGIVFWFLLILPLVLALAFGWVKIQGHPLEHWIVMILRYLQRPRIYVWRSLEE
jgi:hypothetical protein